MPQGGLQAPPLEEAALAANYGLVSGVGPGHWREAAQE